MREKKRMCSAVAVIQGVRVLMRTKTDEKILVDLYKELGIQIASKRRKANMGKADKQTINGMALKISVIIMRLNDSGITSIIDIRSQIKKAKNYYLQYSYIRGRHPELITKSLEIQMDQLLRLVCKHEAEMISGFRLQETGGERLKIIEIFARKSNLKLLGTTFARDIMAQEIRGESLSNDLTYFISNTGNKYHHKYCPFCKGRYLSRASKSMVDYLKLSPCRCISEEKRFGDSSYMTAFIDESLHTVPWEENGCEGKAGSYSYIICRGLLMGETEITNDLVVAQGVDFIGEDLHTERITEAAVGKVLISLLYDYGFEGNVQIYTDNKAVADKWIKSSNDSKLAGEFARVNISYISRKKNKKADALGRTRMLLDIPMDKYNALIEKIKKADTLEKEVQEKEEVIQQLKDQEGVIVVKQLVDLTKGSMTCVS